MTGDVTVVAGPSAVGKGTLVAEIHRRYPGVWLSVSVTTRAARPGEINGIHYHFISDDTFDRLVETHGLLEWATYGNARYGTPAAPVREAIARGQKAILEIDVQGARQIRASMPGARFVFIAPPSWDALEARLRGRGTETAGQIDARLRTAAIEMDEQGEFDHVVVNDEVERAVLELVDLMGLRGADGPSSGSFEPRESHIS